VPERSQEDPPGIPAQEPVGQFGEVLRTFRLRAGMTQRELARQARTATAPIGVVAVRRLALMVLGFLLVSIGELTIG
jgi:hypothetical protein